MAMGAVSMRRARRVTRIPQRSSHDATADRNKSVRMEILPPSEGGIQVGEPSPLPQDDSAAKAPIATLNRHDVNNLTSPKAPGGTATRPPQGEIYAGDLPEATTRVHNQILDVYPNDLTRLIYLASLRDCNGGTYRHPTLSRKYPVQAADAALRRCHEEVFARVLALTVDDYVHQLKGYIRFANVDRSRLIKT